RARNASFERSSQFRVRGHQFFIRRKVKELFSISSPLGFGATVRRYAKFGTGGWETLDVDFRSSRLIRGVRNPFAVRRELSLLLVKGCLQERKCLTVSRHRQYPNIKLSL